MYPKSLIRGASRIHAQLLHIQSVPIYLDLPERAWSECQSLVAQLGDCRRRGWTAAAAVLRQRINSSTERLVVLLERLQTQVPSETRLPRVQTQREILDDLRGLSDEFECVTLDLREQILSVVTSSIELDEIDLGPFEIRLHWPHLGDRRPYQVVAVEPNPASTSRETTHPHVQSEQLCEGAGAAAIQQALHTGRLFDFFQLVNRILHTYNSGSAYVPLANWSGVACNGCGDLIGDDDEYVCDRCCSTLCRDCLTACEGCDALCCHACFNDCRACESVLCSHCQQPCAGCARPFCQKCLSETNFCPECQDDEQSEPPDLDQVQTPVDLPPSAAAAPGDASTASTAAA